MNDYRVFVGAFPTGDLAEQIQAVRLRLDRRTAEITPPHVTVAGTYWRSGPATSQNESAAMQRLAAAAAQIPPFDLQLGGIGVFPGARPVIYLDVQVTAQLLAARAVLLEALGPDQHHSFNPHLTLAMRLDPAPAAAARAELERTPWHRQRFTAPIRELRLMQRGPHDPAWRCIQSVPLN